MTFMPLEEILSHWEKEKELYKIFTTFVEETLYDVIRDQGINVRILSRTKDDISLIKKLYKKNNVTFENYLTITDKSAARVICKFREDTRVVEKCIDETFLVLKKEDKIHNLDFNEQGYKSIHFDVKLKKEKTPQEIYEKIGTLEGEIQVRTHCEDTWAEIYHDLGYKPSSNVTKDVNKQFFCLAGLLEVADNYFSDLNKKITESIVLNEDYALRVLEHHFIKIIRYEYDPELSRDNLRILIPLLNLSSPEEFDRKISSFIFENKDRIHQIFEERNKETCIPYLTQPELFLIFYLIDQDIYALSEKWENESLFTSDLEEICSWWGVPLEDFHSE
jgi:putative GTP pyrophosphokinase